MRRWTWVGLPVTALALLAVAAVVPTGGSTDDDPQRVDVVQSSYACPAGSVITIGSGQVAAGDERVFRPTPDTEVPEAASDAGAWSRTVLDAAGVIVTQTGRESGPVGFFAGRAGKSGGEGLVVGRCGSVVDDAWFLGLGSADRRASTLILSNMSDTPAVADLELWGLKGPIDAVDATGISIEPYTVARIPVADIAAGEPAIALHVDRRRGLLSAVVNDGSTATFGGTEPIGATLAPTRDQHVVGIDGARRGKTLQLLNPGDQVARVDVQVVGEDGPFAVDELQDLKVDAGAFVEIPVPDGAGAGPQALHVVSDREVAATVRVAPSTDDYAVAEAGLPLRGPAVVPVQLGNRVSAPDLVLTAPDGDASLEVVAYDDAMTELDRTTAKVPGGTTTKVSTAEVAKGAAYLVLRADGDVIGAASYTDDDLVSSLLLEPAPTSITAPAVRPAD